MDQITSIGNAIEVEVDTKFSAIGGRITTITCFIGMSHDLSVPVVAGANLQDWPELSIRIPGAKKNSRRSHRSFSNSISICLKGVCIKVFRTGLHITGCKSFRQCQEVAQKMLVFLRSTHKNNIMQIVESRLQLVNVMVDFGVEQDLMALSQRMKDVVCIYDREVYFGLKVKAEIGDRKISVLVFPSGKTVITGIKCVEELSQIYTRVIEQIL